MSNYYQISVWDKSPEFDTNITLTVFIVSKEPTHIIRLGDLDISVIWLYLENDTLTCTFIYGVYL